MGDDRRRTSGLLGRGPTNWYAVIGLVLGLVVGGTIGAYWGWPGLIVGDIIGGALGVVIGLRISRSRRR